MPFAVTVQFAECAGIGFSPTETNTNMYREVRSSVVGEMVHRVFKMHMGLQVEGYTACSVRMPVTGIDAISKFFEIGPRFTESLAEMLFLRASRVVTRVRSRWI